MNLTSEDLTYLSADRELKFTYSVEWLKTDISFNRRFERYLDNSFFEHKVWTGTGRPVFSNVFNSNV